APRLHPRSIHRARRFLRTLVGRRRDGQPRTGQGPGTPWGPPLAPAARRPQPTGADRAAVEEGAGLQPESGLEGAPARVRVLGALAPGPKAPVGSDLH